MIFKLRDKKNREYMYIHIYKNQNSRPNCTKRGSELHFMKDVQLSLNFFKSNGVILNAQNLYKAIVFQSTSSQVQSVEVNSIGSKLTKKHLMNVMSNKHFQIWS